MRRLGVTLVCLLCVLGLSVTFALAAPRPGWWRLRRYEDNPAPIPPDDNEKTEFYWARLQYPDFGGRAVSAAAGLRGRLLDDGLPQERPAVPPGRAAPDAHSRPLDGAGGRPRRRRHLQLPVRLRRGGRPVGAQRRAGEEAARVPRLRGGFLMVDDFHGTYEWEVFMAEHVQRVPGPAGGGHREQGRHLPRALRPGRAVSGSGHCRAVNAG